MNETNSKNAENTVTKKEFDELKSEVKDSFSRVNQKLDGMDNKISDMDQRISDGIESIKVLIEANKHDFKAVAEGHAGLVEKTDDYEERITKLEKRP